MGIGDAPGRCMPVQFPDLSEETLILPCKKDDRRRRISRHPDRSAAEAQQDRRCAGRQAPQARCLRRASRPPDGDLRSPIGARHSKRQAVPRDRGERPGAGGRQPPQIPVPGEYEPRAQDAAQFGSGLHRTVGRRNLRRASGEGKDDRCARAGKRPSPPRAHQRRARPFKDRSGPAHSGARGLFRRADCAIDRCGRRAAGASERSRARYDRSPRTFRSAAGTNAA